MFYQTLFLKLGRVHTVSSINSFFEFEEDDKFLHGQSNSKATSGWTIFGSPTIHHFVQKKIPSPKSQPLLKYYPNIILYYNNLFFKTVDVY